MRFIAGRYFWRPTPAVRKLGFAAEALGEDLTKAVERARHMNAMVEHERKRGGGEPGLLPGSIAHLVAMFRKDLRFTRLAANTQRSYDGILQEIERVAGAVTVKGITRKDLAGTYRKLQSRGLATAAAHMRVWRILLGFAWDEGLRDDNPAKGLHLITPDSRSRVWTPAEVGLFCAQAGHEGRASIGLALRLALALGQRQGDVLALRWSAFSGRGFTIQQNKTGARIIVPLPRELAAELGDMQRPAEHILLSETTGNPWVDGEDHFRHEFARIREAAGLPKDLQFRDLRRTAATDLGAAGATDDEIRAVTGHQSRGVVAVYVRPDTRMAEAAILKREKEVKRVRAAGAPASPVAKPPGEGGKSGGRSRARTVDPMIKSPRLYLFATFLIPT